MYQHEWDPISRPFPGMHRSSAEHTLEQRACGCVLVCLCVCARACACWCVCVCACGVCVFFVWCLCLCFHMLTHKQVVSFNPTRCETLAEAYQMVKYPITTNVLFGTVHFCLRTRQNKVTNLKRRHRLSIVLRGEIPNGVPRLVLMGMVFIKTE